LAPTPVKEYAQTAGIEILQPPEINNPEFSAEIKALDPDLIIVVAYGKILPKSIINIPPLGVINVHGSLLPKYRGAAPIQRAILNGDSETGITIMQIDEKMDTGDILLREVLSIQPDDTSGTLAEKMSVFGGMLLVKALDLMRQNELVPRKQDNSLASPAPPLKKEEGLIDWTRSAFEISCQIRGLDPWPKAHTTLESKWFRLFKPIVIPGEPSEPQGNLSRVDRDGLVIATENDYLLVSEVQREGSKQMPVDAFLCGHPLKPGLRFG
jgi:methionyl-tRNA formyltransferase